VFKGVNYVAAVFDNTNPICYKEITKYVRASSKFLLPQFSLTNSPTSLARPPLKGLRRLIWTNDEGDNKKSNYRTVSI